MHRLAWWPGPDGCGPRSEPGPLLFSPIVAAFFQYLVPDPAGSNTRYGVPALPGRPAPASPAPVRSVPLVLQVALQEWLQQMTTVSSRAGRQVPCRRTVTHHWGCPPPLRRLRDRGQPHPPLRAQCSAGPSLRARSWITVPSVRYPCWWPPIPERSKALPPDSSRPTTARQSVETAAQTL